MYADGQKRDPQYSPYYPKPQEHETKGRPIGVVLPAAGSTNQCGQSLSEGLPLRPSRNRAFAEPFAGLAPPSCSSPSISSMMPLLGRVHAPRPLYSADIEQDEISACADYSHNSSI